MFLIWTFTLSLGTRWITVYAFIASIFQKRILLCYSFSNLFVLLIYFFLLSKSFFMHSNTICWSYLFILSILRFDNLLEQILILIPYYQLFFKSVMASCFILGFIHKCHIKLSRCVLGRFFINYLIDSFKIFGILVLLI